MEQKWSWICELWSSTGINVGSVIALSLENRLTSLTSLDRFKPCCWIFSRKWIDVQSKKRQNWGHAIGHGQTPFHSILWFNCQIQGNFNSVPTCYKYLGVDVDPSLTLQNHFIIIGHSSKFRNLHIIDISHRNLL